MSGGTLARWLPAGFCALACAVLAVTDAHAYIELTVAPRVASCPPIPGAGDLDLTPEEWDTVARGEIVMRIVEPSPGERMAQALGYLDADPVWLFDLSTDSSLAHVLVEDLVETVVLERDRHGKLFSSVLDPGIFLVPKFEYTLASAYPVPATGQCWAQVEGDFEVNEGSHSYLWAPRRGQSLGVFTFVFRLRGLLRFLPEGTVLKRCAGALEHYMRKVEAMARKLRVEDPVRARRNAAGWALLRPRLEAGEFPQRLWTGYPPRPLLNPPDPAMAELHTERQPALADQPPLNPPDPASPEIHGAGRRPGAGGNGSAAN